MRRGQRASAGQVVLKLRQIEVQRAQGKRLVLACREAEISEQNYYRWRKEYGGFPVDQARKMKDLERENARSRRPVADLSWEKQVVADVASGMRSDRLDRRAVARRGKAGFAITNSYPHTRT